MPLHEQTCRTRLVAVTCSVLACCIVGIPAESAEKAARESARKFTAAALSQRIDQLLFERLSAEKVPASPRADDAEFLRRVYLDIAGVIPPADMVKPFLESKDPQKRSKLIDELLASPLFGRRMADVWSGLMIPKNSDNNRLVAAPLHTWLEKQFNENKPWDQLVHDLLTATGNQGENGAVTYFLANPTADKVTDVTASLFMGVQLQCAQCHNHPFTKWKQDEYWGMAMFFTKVRPDSVRKAAKDGSTPGILESSAARGKKQPLPESAKSVPPKFLQGEQPKLNQTEPFRPVLAKWLTAPENPFFARAFVNRAWAQLFGRGIVNAVDDMHEKNQPSHPELLAELTREFIAGGHDVKELFRTVCNSQAYQRTSKPVAGNEEHAALVSRMAVKVMTPEQLFDSLQAVVGPGASEGGRDRKKPAAGRNQPKGERAQFVAFFQTDDGADPTEYQSGIPQALRLMNNGRYTNGGALLNQVAKPGIQPAEAVEALYLATLARRPTQAESQRLAGHVEQTGKEARKACSDILWALLNSSEFTLNH